MTSQTLIRLGEGFTYIPMSKLFFYLVAIVELFSRNVLSRKLSNGLDSQICMVAS